MENSEGPNISQSKKQLKDRSLIELRNFVNQYAPELNDDKLSVILEEATEAISNSFEELSQRSNIGEIASLNKVRVVNSEDGKLKLTKKKFFLRIKKENILDLAAQSASLAAMTLSIPEHSPVVAALTVIGILAVIKSTSDVDELQKIEITPVHLDVIKAIANHKKGEKISKRNIVERLVKSNEGVFKNEDEKNTYSVNASNVIDDLTKVGLLRNEGNDIFSLRDKIKVTI